MALQSKVYSAGDYAWKSWSNGYVISLTLTEESTSISNNTSLVSYLFTISNTDNNRFVSNDYSWSISIGTQSIPISNFNFNLGAYNTTQTIASGQVTVTHNADGTLDMPFQVSIPNVQTYTSYGPPAMSLTGSMAMTQIPRQATLLTATDFDEDGNPSITYTNPAGDAVASLQVCISITGYGADTAWQNVPKTGTSYTLNLTAADISALKAGQTPATSRSVYVILKTNIGGVAYHSSVLVSFTRLFKPPVMTSAPDFTDEVSPKITFTNPCVGYYALRVKIEAGGNTQLIVKTPSASAIEYTFSLTDAERNVLRSLCPNSNTLPVRFTVCYMNGSTELSSSSLDRTMTIVNASPTITTQVFDSNDTTFALTGDRNRIVRYYSTLTAAVSATAYKGALISKRIISYGGKDYDADNIVIQNANSATVKFKVADTRGNTISPNPTTVTKTLVNYVKLSCTIGSGRPAVDGSMTITAKGNYFNSTFGAVANTLSVQYRYKVSGGSYGAWTNMTATKSGNTYNASTTFTIPDFNYKTTYVFQTRAIDKLATVSSEEYKAKTTPVFDWGENDFRFNVNNVMIASDSTPYLVFEKTNGGDIAAHAVNGTNHMHYLRSYATDTSYYEQFRTPAVSTGLTTSKTYDFLTTKAPVTIEQGGTGATNRLKAAANLTAEAVSSPQLVVGLTANFNNYGFTTLSQLKTAMGLNYTVDTSVSGLTLVKCNGIVHAYSHSGFILASAAIPSGYRPKNLVEMEGVAIIANYTEYRGRIRVSTTGEITANWAAKWDKPTWVLFQASWQV